MQINKTEIEKISGKSDTDFIIQDLIENNCRQLNVQIACYDWKDNRINKKLKTLILYSPAKAYKFDILKRFVDDIPRFKKIITKFIRRSLETRTEPE